MTREQSLLDFLGLGEAGEGDLGIVPSYRENEFSVNGGDYLVLTDSEADEAAKEDILDSLWAFNASFLASETELDEAVFEAIQNNDKCESNNEAMTALVKSTCGIDSFVESAIFADGRGPFLSRYDGEEGNAGEYFVYRTA